MCYTKGAHQVWPYAYTYTSTIDPTAELTANSSMQEPPNLQFTLCPCEEEESILVLVYLYAEHNRYSTYHG